MSTLYRTSKFWMFVILSLDILFFNHPFTPNIAVVPVCGRTSFLWTCFAKMGITLMALTILLQHIFQSYITAIILSPQFWLKIIILLAIVSVRLAPRFVFINKMPQREAKGTNERFGRRGTWGYTPTDKVV